MKFFLNLLVYPLAFLVPRQATLWAFGSPDGTFEGNSKFLFLWTSQNAPDIRAVWISSNRSLVEHLTRQGYRAATRWSWAGVRAALTAAVHFVTRNGGDTNFALTGGSRIFNLWHGVGIKNILRGSAVGKNATLFRFRWFAPLYLRSLERFKPPTFVLSTSPTMSRHFARCFGVPLQACVEAGYPRQDPFDDELLRLQALQFDDASVFENACADFDKVYLYAPTLRQNGADFLKESLPELDVLSAALRRTGALLWVKPHPGNALDAEASRNLPHNIRMWPQGCDFYALVHRIDCLITDYSSMLYDFIGLKSSGVIIYDFDYQEFIQKERDLAFPFDENIVGLRASSFPQLCEAIANDAAAQPLDRARLSELRERFWGAHTLVPSACASIHHHVRTSLGLPSLLPGAMRALV